MTFPIPNLGLTSTESLSKTNANQINITPTGYNLGEILRPFNEGSSVNGGSGFALPSLFSGRNQGVPGIPLQLSSGLATKTSVVKNDPRNGPILFGAAVVGITLLAIAFKKRRG